MATVGRTPMEVAHECHRQTGWVVHAHGHAGFDFGEGDKRAQELSFGKQLGNQRDRVIGGYRISFAGTVQRINRSRLVPTPPSAFAAPTPEP